MYTFRYISLQSARECAILLLVPALCNFDVWTANPNHSFIFANNQKALVALSSTLSHSFPLLSCFQAKSSLKSPRQERKWKDALLIDSHSPHSHMRMDQCMDISGPWRQHALMCTTFLYVQTHLTLQKEKAAESCLKIKWSTKEKGGTTFSCTFIKTKSSARTWEVWSTPQHLLSKRTSPVGFFPVLEKSYFTRGKLVFSSQNLAPGTFSRHIFGRRVRSQYGFP